MVTKFRRPIFNSILGSLTPPRPMPSFMRPARGTLH